MFTVGDNPRVGECDYDQQLHQDCRPRSRSGRPCRGLRVLAKAGQRPIVIEKAKVVGGLMRSIKRGDFIVDVGRKELYNRLERVDSLWAEILASDYRAYPHRGGILYKGHIIEISPKFRGATRGMPLSMMAGAAWDLVLSRARSNGAKAANLEEYFYRKRGRRLTQIVSQGFQEKLAGTKWVDVPLPADYVERSDASLLKTAAALGSRTFSRKEANTFEGVWRHPAKGTGQICNLFEERIRELGGTFVLDADVREINSEQGQVTDLVVETGGTTTRHEIQHLVSSVPAQHLLRYLLKERFNTLNAAIKNPPSSQRVIVLVYLFLDARPGFPHAWLNVTCPDTRIGRITNYSALGGEMVPDGKSCLCCEFFVAKDDPLAAQDDKALVELALAECVRYKLTEPGKLLDSMVLRLPGADALTESAQLDGEHAPRSAGRPEAVSQRVLRRENRSRHRNAGRDRGGGGGALGRP